MRIAFDHQIFAWQRYGGISRYFYELATHLAADGQDAVRIVAPLYANRYLAEQPPACLFGRPVPSWCKSAGLDGAVNTLAAGAILMAWRPDIVHETYYSGHRTHLAGARRVLTVYDMIHERLPGCFRRPQHLTRKKRAAVDRADHVICISEHTRRDLVELFDVAPEKTSVVPLGFALTQRIPAPLPDALAGRPYLLYVGDRHSYKNFSGLLHAMAASATLKAAMTLVCFGGGALHAEELALMDRLGLARDRVLQVGGDDALLAALYGHARAFICPSLYEGFGIPVLEAMGLGCPVICGNRSSLPEVAGDAAMLVEAADPGALGAAIESVLGSASLRAELIARGHERVRHFSWARCAEQTRQVYRKVLAS